MTTPTSTDTGLIGGHLLPDTTGRPPQPARSPAAGAPTLRRGSTPAGSPSSGTGHRSRPPDPIRRDARTAPTHLAERRLRVLAGGV